MKKDIKILEQAIANYYKINKRHKKMEIREPKNNEPNMLQGIVITDLYNDSFAIKLDAKDEQYIPVFNASKRHLNKACDGIIFYKKKDFIHVFFIELKSNNYSLDDITMKFIISDCFVDYLSDILKKIGEISNLIYKKHFCLFTTSQMIKITDPAKSYKLENKKGIDLKIYPAKSGSVLQDFKIKNLIN